MAVRGVFETFLSSEESVIEVEQPEFIVAPTVGALTQGIKAIRVKV
jgi:hypothetical protein